MSRTDRTGTASPEMPVARMAMVLNCIIEMKTVSSPRMLYRTLLVLSDKRGLFTLRLLGLFSKGRAELRAGGKGLPNNPKGTA